MERKTKISNAFLVSCLAVIGIAVYMFSFGNGMFWDDDDFILRNAYIQDWQYLPKLFSENMIAGAGLVSNYWRPILLVVFSLEWHLWGDWAPGWHMVNTLFHVANGVMLFYILIGITRRQYANDTRMTRINPTWLAFLVALLFLIHPVQVETVAYANSLGDSLSVFWMFLGILCFQKYASTTSSDKWAWLTLSVLTYPLALMSKETGIVMPGLIALVALIHYRTHRTYATYKTYITPLISFAIIALAYLWLRATALNFKNSFNLYGESNVFTDSLWVRLLTFCKIIIAYIKLVFWPQALHMERSLEFATSLWDWQVILGGLIIIGLLTIAWKSWRKNLLVSFGILWFFIALAPTSNILVPINGLLYEHWLYVPIIGVGVALAGVILRLYGEEPRGLGQARTITTLILILIAIALSTRSILRIREWRDPVTFYQQTIQYAPNSYRINNNLGMALADAERFTEAANYYQKAISLDPNNPVAYHNMGNIYEAAQNPAQAIPYYEKALELDPKFLFSYPKLVNNYTALEKYQEAIKALKAYQKFAGSSPELQRILAALESKKTKE